MQFLHDSHSIFAIDKHTRIEYIEIIDGRRGAGRKPKKGP